MLEHYASRLNGVELNGSFYRTPPATTLERWRDGTPPGFLFCMKANRGLTYSADSFDRVGLARLFTERISTMGDRLGPVLLQFPPVRQRSSWHRNEPSKSAGFAHFGGVLYPYPRPGPPTQMRCANATDSRGNMILGIAMAMLVLGFIVMSSMIKKALR